MKEQLKEVGQKLLYSFQELPLINMTQYLSGNGQTAVVVGTDYAGNVSVQVLRKQESQWLNEGNLLPMDWLKSDLYGAAVAISHNGDMVFISSPRRSVVLENEGMVYCYSRMEGHWKPHSFIIQQPPEKGALFGISVACSEDGRMLYVGAEGADQHEGAVFQYQLTRRATWNMINKIKPDTPVRFSRFGKSIYLNSIGNKLVVSAPAEAQEDGSICGKVFIFTLGDDVSPETRTSPEKISLPEDVEEVKSFFVANNGSELILQYTNSKGTFLGIWRKKEAYRYLARTIQIGGYETSYTRFAADDEDLFFLDDGALCYLKHAEPKSLLEEVIEHCSADSVVISNCSLMLAEDNRLTEFQR